MSTVELRIGGMTCATCAARVEKKLNRLDGVTATVNFATETARIEYASAVSLDDLVRTVEATGYRAIPPPPPSTPTANATTMVAPAPPPEPPAGHETLDHRVRWSAALTAPVLVLSMTPALQFPNWQWLALTLATPVVAWAAWPFHRAALRHLRHGAATMDTLVSLGVVVSYAWSLFALFAGHAGERGMRMELAWFAESGSATDHIYLEVGTALTTFLLAGRWFEARAKRRAGSALRALLDLGAKEATLLRDRVEQRVPIGAVQVGDAILVRPGEKIAADGVVVEGTSAVDASLLTGESAPVEVGPGDPVTGGCVNAGGRLVVRATRVGAQTRLAQMARLVSEAQSGKAPVQRLADRISAVFVPVVISVAVATYGFWLGAGGGSAAALTSAVAVLIVACPCALGLATPTALLVGTGRGAQLGILIKGPEVLESTRRVDTVLLDKTGTITTGEMALVSVAPADGVEAEELISYAAAVERASEHPIARAIAAAATDQATVDDFRALPGLGAQGTVAGREVLVGRPGLLAARGIAVPSHAAAAPGATHPAAGSGRPRHGDVAARLAADPRIPGRGGRPGRPRPRPRRRHGPGTGPAPGADRALAGAGGTAPSGSAGTGTATLGAAVATGTAGTAGAATTVAVAWDGVYRGTMVVADTVKPSSAEAVRRLRALGLRPVLLTGDSAAVAAGVAAQVGIAEVIAEVLPEEKVAAVRRLQRQGRVVAMVGDGVNDAGALAAADLGLAMGTGTDAAIDASDLTLVRGDLTVAADAIRLSRATLRAIKGNLFWAFAYNIAAIPLAAAGLVTPVLAAAAMAFSSVFVVTNSLRLFRFRPAAG